MPVPDALIRACADGLWADVGHDGQTDQEEVVWIADRIERAETAADAGETDLAADWIETVARRVHGVYSDTYRRLGDLFPAGVFYVTEVTPSAE